MYRPLLPAEIRLLRLNAPDKRGPGELETVSIDDAPPYYALSHSWGHQGRTVTVEIGSCPTHLGSDLAGCLQRLQELSVKKGGLEEPVEYIWIDTICINQEDLEERASQVGLMGRIYGQAMRTLAWLGADSTCTHAAWPLLDSINDVLRRQNPTAVGTCDIPVRMYDENLHKSSGLPDWEDEQWAHLRHLMNMSWFSRIWVVQEIVLSRQDPVLLLGAHSYSFSRLAMAVSWIRRSGYMRLPQIPQQLRNVDTMNNIRQSRTTWPLDALISITQAKFRATDQRDKVYGLLGLSLEGQVGKALPDALQPDYTANVTVIYQRVAQYLLARSRSLALLTRARGLEGTATRNIRQYDLDLPSWAPDWSDFREHDRAVTCSLSWLHFDDTSKPAMLGFPHHYLASDGLDLILHHTEDYSVLSLSVLKLDVVRNVARFTLSRVHGKDKEHGPAEEIFEVLMMAISCIEANTTLDFLESFIRATTTEQHRLGGKDWAQSFKDGLAYLDNLLLHDPSSASSLKQGQYQKVARLIHDSAIGGVAEHYEALVRNYCFDRAFFITAAGRMGLGPSNVSQGDIVSVIPGGGVPYCIRNSRDHWLFMGESYVEGLMRGEAISVWQAGEVLEETLNLR